MARSAFAPERAEEWELAEALQPMAQAGLEEPVELQEPAEPLGWVEPAARLGERAASR